MRCGCPCQPALPPGPGARGLRLHPEPDQHREQQQVLHHPATAGRRALRLLEPLGPRGECPPPLASPAFPTSPASSTSPISPSSPTSPASPSSAQAPAAQGPTPYSGPRPQKLTVPGAQHRAWHHSPASAMEAAQWAPLKAVNCRGRWASPSSATSRPWRMQRRTSRRNLRTRPRTAGRSGSTSWPSPASTRSSKCKARTRPRRLW